MLIYAGILILSILALKQNPTKVFNIASGPQFDLFQEFMITFSTILFLRLILCILLHHKIQLEYIVKD